jgi:hypothetical protein
MKCCCHNIKKNYGEDMMSCSNRTLYKHIDQTTLQVIIMNYDFLFLENYFTNASKKNL